MVEWTIIGNARLACGDAREILPTLPKADAVVTDPPYGIGACGASYKGGTRWKGGSQAETWDTRPEFDFLAGAGKAIVWGGNFFAFPPSRAWLIWDKKFAGMSFSEAEMAWTNLPGGTRIIRYNGRGPWPDWKHGEERHPTQKPLAVMEWCLGFLPAADTILDPFMGSGTTGVACAKLGRSFTGIEIDSRHFDRACRRIEAAEANLFASAAE